MMLQSTAKLVFHMLSAAGLQSNICKQKSHCKFQPIDVLLTVSACN